MHTIYGTSFGLIYMSLLSMTHTIGLSTLWQLLHQWVKKVEIIVPFTSDMVGDLVYDPV